MTRIFQRVLRCLAAPILITLGVVQAAVATAAPPTFLPQGWNAAERDWMYGFSQGSQIIPYDWFRALERPASTERFAADGLARFGYLPRARGPGNPDGLPVGFAIDTDAMGKWIGMNCTACHTGQIQFEDRLLQVDGAPAGADFYAFIAELGQAMQATVTERDKFGRFAARVRATNTAQSPADLRQALQATAQAFTQFVADSTPASPWGPARTDAFGMIFNRVTGMDLENRGNLLPPDGPVSYPFLWTTNRQRWIQWTGSVPNEIFLERLGRNVGQVLGVFGRMPHLASGIPLDPRRFRSSVRGRALVLADELVGKLEPPRWPGPIDAALAARGQTLFAQNCESCHRNAASGSTGAIEVGLTPLDEVGTDGAVADKIAARRSVTGPLKGYPVRFVPLKRLDDPDSTSSVLAAVVSGAILNPRTWLTPIGLDVVNGAGPGLAAARIVAGNVGDDVRQALERAGGVQYMNGRPASAGLVYKAGPLNGIWATAPYLHNGSVATLSELLGVEPRRAKFFVGSKVYDVARMGFVSDRAPGLFEFDTAASGNSSKGHTYTEGLSAGDRRALLEYLKTL